MYQRPHKILFLLFGSVGIYTALLLVLFFLRFIYSISFDTPLQLSTSGGENQSIYAVWRYIANKPVYTSEFHVPFSTPYYNWLFYVFYGSITKLSLFLFSLSDAWIPTIGRLITLSVTGIGSLFLFLISKKILSPSNRRAVPLLIAFSIILMFGPLTGFWVISVRSDILTVVLEIIAIYFLFQYVETKKIKFLITTIIFCYLSWATKQYSIFLITGLTLSLFIFKQWRSASLAVSISFFLYALTFILGSDDYVANIFSLTNAELNPSVGIDNWVKYIGKTALFVLPLLSYILYGVFQSNLKFNRQLFCSSLTTYAIILSGGVSLGIAGIFVFQDFASQNYFFSSSIYVYFLFLIIFKRNWDTIKDGSGYFLPLVSASSAINSIVVLLYLTSQVGILNPQFSASNVEASINCFKDLPKPILTSEPMYQLPWISGNHYPFHLLVSHHYPINVAQDLEKLYDFGGIQGMLDSGLIASVVPYPLDFEHKNYQMISQSSSDCDHLGLVYVNKRLGQ